MEVDVSRACWQNMRQPMDTALHITIWKSYERKRPRGRPARQWRDELGDYWKRTAQDRQMWKQHAEAIAQPQDTKSHYGCTIRWRSRKAFLFISVMDFVVTKQVATFIFDHWSSVHCTTVLHSMASFGLSPSSFIPTCPSGSLAITVRPVVVIRSFFSSSRTRAGIPTNTSFESFNL